MHASLLPLPPDANGAKGADKGAQRGHWQRLLHGVFAALVVAGISACTSLPANTGRTESHALADPSATTLYAKVAAATPTDQARRSWTGFRLLPDVASAYGSRLALIDAAEKTLDLQYYSVHYDHSTEELMARLRAAAARGVHVRMLIDDFNAGGENAKVLRLDEVAGMEVRLFNPVGGPRDSQMVRIAGAAFDFQRAQKRMHNKNLIADNVLAITGGRNLGDEYFGQSRKSNFLDLDVLVAGRLVQDISRSFDYFWNDPLAYPAATLLTQAERAKVAEDTPPPVAAPGGPSHGGDAAPTTVLATVPQATATNGVPTPGREVPGAANTAQQLVDGKLQLSWAPAVFMADKPTKISAEDPADTDDGGDTVVDGMLRLIQQARTELLIVSPYFVPGGDMMQAFGEVRARGVRVRVLTNSLASNDAPLAHVGYARYRKALLAMGVELYEMQATGDTRRRLLGSAPQSRSSLHAKTMVMDRRLLVVGTMNLDMRSQLQNTEGGIIIRSRSLAQELTGDIEETLRHSYRVELRGDALRWVVPPADTQHGETVLDSEPDASAGLELMLKIIGPFAPDQIL